MRPHVDGLRDRGIDARAIDLPRGVAERAVPRFADLLAGDPDLAVGGHSFGGRVASFAAAQQPARALVLLSYPLHAPGRPETAEARSAHFPAIRCPVLLLSGEADPFARLDLLRAAVARLPNVALVTYPRIGHGLGPALDDALDRIAAFLKGLAGPGWRHPLRRAAGAAAASSDRGVRPEAMSVTWVCSALANPAPVTRVWPAQPARSRDSRG